jgi:hypothetical protein
MVRLPKPSGFGRLMLVVAGLVASLVTSADSLAYTAAGDRVFAPTGILPQIAPTNQIYGLAWTVPQSGQAVGTRSRATNTGAFFDKTVFTDQLSVYTQGSWIKIDRVAADPRYGWANFENGFKYMPINDDDRELLLTLGVNREWGATGTSGTAPRKGATEPRVYFGKGLGDFDIGYLRPFALTGFLGYLAADAEPRPDLVRGGVALQYSIPYLQSKVQSFDLPSPIRGLTPLTELLVTAPAGRSYGARPTVLFATGLSYAGEGWEFVIEALVPATRATGEGAGVRAQLHLVLDFLSPQIFGRPLFAWR